LYFRLSFEKPNKQSIFIRIVILGLRDGNLIGCAVRQTLAEIIGLYLPVTRSGGSDLIVTDAPN
jgi:hypothetical protein